MSGACLSVAGLGLAAAALLARWPRAWLAATLAAAAAGLMAALAALAAARAWDWHGVLVLGGEAVHLRLDGLSALFLALLAVIGGAGAAYAHEYWSEHAQPASARRGRAWWSLLVLCMGLVLLCSNGLHFLIAWEAFALCGFFLITLEHERDEVRAAGWLYLGLSHAGTLVLFAFFALLAARTGSFDLGPLREHAELAPLFWLALFGFGVKAGLFPLHVWLPSAHANAPSHVSAILSGVAIKLGLYGIVRFSGWLPAPAGAGWVVIALGALGAVLGAAFTLAQNDLKRLLAYCSVENVGVILIAVGTALLGAAHGDAAWGRLALVGGLLHVWNHGLVKSLLFFGAGSVLHATGTREMSRLGGLWRGMPWTAGLFALGSLAIVALPPANAFVSEWLVYLGLFQSAAGHAHVGAATLPAALALALTGALSLAAFVKACAIVFLGASRTKDAARAHECGPWMRAPMLCLGVLVLATALAPALCWRGLAGAAAAWNPAWSGLEPLAPLASVGWVNAALLVALCAAATGLNARVRARARRALTWDCGYAAPTARMQYTGASFSALAAGWFEWALRPRRRIRRPRGPFPARADHLEELPETVLERIVVPLGGRVMVASAWVRRRQHGRLQDYILYLVAGLAGVALLVFAWSLR